MFLTPRVFCYSSGARLEPVWLLDYVTEEAHATSTKKWHVGYSINQPEANGKQGIGALKLSNHSIWRDEPPAKLDKGY